VCDVDATLFVQYKPPAFTADGHPFLDIVVVERDRAWFADQKAALHTCWLEFMSARAAAALQPERPPPPPPANACLVDYDLYTTDSM
jgi:recombination DNA repair RAD52 pathway protein